MSCKVTVAKEGDTDAVMDGRVQLCSWARWFLWVTSNWTSL